MRRMCFAVVAVAVVVSACGGDGGTPRQAEQSDAAEGESGGVVFSAVCEDDAGDARARISAGPFSGDVEDFEGEIPGHVDLRRADMSVSDDMVTVGFETAAPLRSGDGSILPLAEAQALVIVDGNVLYSLKIGEEGEPGSFEFTEEGGAKRSDAGTVDMEGNRASLSIPLTAVPRMDDEFHWFASVAAREDTGPAKRQVRASDTCPNLSQQEILQIARQDKEAPAKILQKLHTQPFRPDD